IRQRTDIDRLLAADHVGPRHRGRLRRKAVGIRRIGKAEAPMRCASFALKLEAILFAEPQRAPVVNGRQTARELAGALALQFVRSLVAGIETAGSLEFLGDSIITRDAIRLTRLLVPCEAKPVQ